MSFSRLAQIPIDHVVAEVAAFPLASEAALKGCVTELDPLLKGTAADLWREAERHALGHFPGFSIDEVVAVRDRVWFSTGQRDSGPVPLATYLTTLAGMFLRPEGDVAIPCLPDEDTLRRQRPALQGPLEAHARFAWRWLSFALPPDLLLAAVAPAAPPGNVQLLSPALAQMLRDSGYAESHLHLGCTLDFSSFWVCLLRALADKAGTGTNAFHSPGAPFREGRDLAPWLLSAAITRYVLAAYLHGRHQLERLEAFVAATVLPRLVRAAGPAAGSMLLLCLSELVQGRLQNIQDTFRHRQELYSQLIGARVRKFPKHLEQVQHADPIAPFFLAVGPGRPTPEMGFVAKGLCYLLEDAKNKKEEQDRTFAVLFWQMLRLRVAFFRHIVQRPMTPGLQWFIRFYSRMKTVGRFASKTMLFESAASQGGIGRGLRSLEVRTCPDVSHSKLYLEVLSVECAGGLARDGSFEASSAKGADGTMRPRLSSSASTLFPNFEYGMVFHFARDRGGRAIEGNPTPHGLGSNADPYLHLGTTPNGNPTGYRYAVFYQAKKREALSLAWLLRHYPRSLEVVRGLDLCTDELGVPAWVFVPLLQHVSAAGNHAAALLRQHGSAPAPLRMTIHAGEDFVHLQTGLRHVDEIGRYFDLRQGSRIGHGLALGVDPRTWAHRAGRIPVIREDRLFDLVWEWAWYGREASGCSSNRQHFLEREITRLAETIFGRSRQFGPAGPCEPSPPSAYELDRLVHDLHDPVKLWTVGFPDSFSPPVGIHSHRRLSLLYTFLTNPNVFRRGREVEWLDPAAEAEVLAGLQTGIRRKFGEYGIAVEVNPTSNLLVGDIQDLKNHPLWRLRPPRPGGDCAPMSICIGSDDPLTFGTSLPAEYQFLHDALTLAGLSDEEARHWLDRTRASALENRFTLPRTTGTISALRNLAKTVVALRP